MTEYDLQQLELAEAALFRMNRTLALSLSQIAEIAKEQRKPIKREIRILTASVRDAERTHRPRIKTALLRKLCEMEDRLWAIDREEEIAKQIVTRHHSEYSAEARRRASVIRDAIASEKAVREQQELRLRRFRKIPVLR
jgi:hypothetical protein